MLLRAKPRPFSVPEQDSSLNTIFQLIRKSTGVDFTHYRHTTIRRRIQRRMIVHKIDSLPRYVKYVQQNPAELKALYQDMLINVTSFFRNPARLRCFEVPYLPRHPQAPHPKRSPSAFGSRAVPPAKRPTRWPSPCSNSWAIAEL